MNPRTLGKVAAPPLSSMKVSHSQVGQNFSFVLTDIDSKQRFGFCRLNQGCRICICLLSYLPWFEIYYKLLNTLADYLTKHQENDLNDMLNSLYDMPVPTPYTPINLNVNEQLYIATGHVLRDRRSVEPHSYFIAPDINGLPTIPESRNLTEYFVAVDITNMLQLYASMLHERRIIVTSSKLSTLTACVHGAAAMLYPMYWQHIFIPVLPPHLLDYCCAPMPYLVGVHLSLLERVRSRSLEDVVILNVDTNTLESPADDLQNLPSDVVSSLKSKLKKQSTATGSGVSRAFLRAQAALFGSYRDALRYKPGEPITFCEESFANHRSSAMRNFLSMAINLQLFKQFIDGRLAKLNAGRGFTDVFEEEITEGGFCGSNSRSYQQWMHTVKRGGALINTAVTKARSHAKKGLRDIKGRLKAREEEDEGATLCAGSPTSTKSLSPRRLQKMRRQQNFPRPGLNMTAQDMGFDDDELDTASKLSSEDSGEVGSLMEDSDDSYSLELEEMASPQAGQMNLLDEILDSLSSSKTLDQGRLSAAKSLDFLKSSEDVDYAGLNKSTASSDCKAASGGVSGDRGEPGAWHTGQDDSSLHGKHLPPSPRRMPNKSSLRGLHRRPPGAPPARPTRPITMMAPVTGGSLAPRVGVPCRPQSDHLAASPPPSRRSAASDPPLTSTSLSRSAPPARPVESPPEIPRQGSRNHRGNPVEALVPWEKEAGEQRDTEVNSGKARGSVGGLKEGGLLGGFHGDDFLGGVQEKGLLEEIDYTLQNSPRLAPRLQRSSNTEACVRRVRIKPADLQKS
ncbi:unnamed protein product [Merluccius merluccius]